MEVGVTDLLHGFSIALQPQNLLYCLISVVAGNMVGILPGMGVLSAISILLPLTYGMPPVGAILMLAGLAHGAQYGGAICSFLLNLPCHPPHAVTCLDGFPLTRQGKGGTALGITMTILGLLLGLVGQDINTGVERFTFGIIDLDDEIEIVALSLGLFGIAEFLRDVNNTAPINSLADLTKHLEEKKDNLFGYANQTAQLDAMPETAKFLESVAAIPQHDTGKEADARLRAELPKMGEAGQSRRH